MAFTYAPASIGAERLQFLHPASGSLFASGIDVVAIEFEAKQTEQEKADSIVDRLFAAVAAKFRPAQPFRPTPANGNFDPPGAFATDVRTAFSGSITAALKPITEAPTWRIKRDRRLDATTATLAHAILMLTSS